MIFVTDKGRMANNIFQYGHLYAWGREHNRATMSMRFAHKYPEFRIAHTRYHNAVVYVLAKLAAKLHVIPTVEFNLGQTPEKEQQLTVHRHILATGWGVRFNDLFLKYKDEIVQLFDFMPQVRQRVAQTMQPSTTGAIKLGVHIRRGDYKMHLGGRFYYNDEEYADVIRQFASLHSGKQVDVYICTDDRQLNHDFFHRQLPQLRLFFPCGTAAEDLCLLSECDYLIGPLSSFTLIASMYRGTPLYWMMNRPEVLTPDSFHNFDYQVRHFDANFAASRQ